VVEKKKKTKKTEPGLYNGAELAATLGTVGSRVGELEAAISNNKRDAYEKIAHLEKAIAELASTVATAVSSTGTPIGDGAMLREAIKAAVKAEIDEIAITVSQGVVAGTGDELRKVIRDELEADRKANPLRR